MKKNLILLLFIIVSTTTAWAKTVTFDLTKASNFIDSKGVPYSDTKSGEIDVDAPLISDVISINHTGSNNNYFWNSTSGTTFRMRQSGAVTFSGHNGEIITKIEFIKSGTAGTLVASDPENGDFDGITWIGNSTSIKINCTVNIKMSAIIVTYNPINDQKEIPNIDGFMGLTKGDIAKITGTLAITYVSDDGKYIYAQDESGYLMITSDTPITKYKNGDRIMGLIGTVDVADNLNIMNADVNSLPNVISNEPILPNLAVVQPFNATSDGKYVTIKMVKLNLAKNGINDAIGNVLASHDKFGVISNFPINRFINIIGILSYSNNSGLRIFPISYTECDQIITNIGDESAGITDLATAGIGVYKINAPLTVTYQKDNVILANDGVDIRIDGPTEAHVATAFDDNPSNFTHTNWVVLNAMDNTDFTGKQIAAGFAGELTNATALEMNIMSAVTSVTSTNPITPNTYKLWNFTGIIERDGKVINAYLVTPRENEYVKFDQVNLRIQNGVKTITDSEHRELPIDETYLTLAGDDWNAFPLEAIVKTRPITKASNARGIAADREWVIYPVKQGDIATGVDAITGNANAAIVKGGAGVINITAVAQGKVEVYSTAGALVATQSIAEGANTISIATGLYIVRIDGKATKIIVL